MAGSFYGVLYTIYLIDELHLSPLMLGIVVSAGGVGSLIGSFFASRTIGRLGIGPALIWAAAGASIIGILTPLAGGPIALATLMVFLPQLIGDGLQTIEGVAELSLIQGVIPDRILGRVNATLEVFSHGIAYPLGRCWPRRWRASSASAAASSWAGPGWRCRSRCSCSRPFRASESQRIWRLSRGSNRHPNLAVDGNASYWQLPQIKLPSRRGPQAAALAFPVTGSPQGSGSAPVPDKVAPLPRSKA